MTASLFLNLTGTSKPDLGENFVSSDRTLDVAVYALDVPLLEGFSTQVCVWLHVSLPTPPLFSFFFQMFTG